MPSSTTNLFRFAHFVVLCALLVLIDGAVVTSHASTLPPDAPGLAQVTNPGLAEAVHPWLAAVLAVLTVILTIMSPGILRRLAGALLLLVIVQAGIGSHGAVIDQVQAQPWMVVHAILAQLYFAGAVAMLAVTSPTWHRGPELVEDYGWPSLRSFSVTTPVIVLIQICLGAALRHKTMGALSHLGFALVVALWILIECVFLIQQFPQHRILRPAANWVLALTCAQVFLGMGAFTMRTMDMEGAGLAAVTAAHLANGAITLAMTVVLSIHIRRNVMPKGSLACAA